MSAASAAPRQHFLEFVRAARYEEGLPPEDISETDDASLVFALNLEGIWFTLEHSIEPDSPADQQPHQLLVRALVYKLPEEPGPNEELILREALRMTRTTMHACTGSFAIDPEERELHFISLLPVDVSASEALPILRQAGSMLAQWRSHVLNAS